MQLGTREKLKTMSYTAVIRIIQAIQALTKDNQLTASVDSYDTFSSQPIMYL